MWVIAAWWNIAGASIWARKYNTSSLEEVDWSETQPKIVPSPYSVYSWLLEASTIEMCLPPCLSPSFKPRIGTSAKLADSLIAAILIVPTISFQGRDSSYIYVHGERQSA